MPTTASEAVPLTNWAGNVRFSAARLLQPTSVPDLQEMVAAAGRVRALGTGHSFNAIADTEGDLLSLKALPALLDIDSTSMSVLVSAGTTYGELGAALQGAALALPNTGSLPHICIAGACATGTHGSGVGNAVLGRGVRKLRMAQADGELVSAQRGDADFDGYVLSLGRLGIVTDVVLDVVPTFDVAQTVVVSVPDASIEQQLADILSSAYSVSVFTRFARNGHRIWVKDRADAIPRSRSENLWGGRSAAGPEHPIEGIDPQFATAQLGVVGPWHERMPHFRVEFTPSAGDELQSEYILPMTDAAAAWAAVAELSDSIRGPLLVCEVRAIAGDSMWLSTTGGRDSVAFHFTWERDADRVLPLVREIERALAPFDARPHWGKVFTTPPAELARLYPRLADFRRLVTRHDPAGKFSNALVDGWIGN